jgi:hypothetical protein
MPDNGSGTWTRNHDFTADRDANVKIQASRVDTELDDIGTALTNRICKDGQTTTTAAIPFAVGLRVSTGSVGTPSIGVIGDTNCGWYFPAADTIAAAVGGANAMTIASTGVTFNDLLAATIVPQGRLTLTTAVPVMTSDTTGQTTVYYTPYTGNLIPLYNGTNFVLYDFTELSQATTDSTKSPAAVTTNSNYDVFVWVDSGTLRATRGPAWTSDTARGTGAGTTELERVNGLWVNKVAITNGPGAQRGTYVGTIRTNGSSQVDYDFGGTGAGGAAAVIGVWNCFNRVDVYAAVHDSTDSWTYGTATWRSSNNSTAMRVSMVRGLNEDGVECSFSQNLQTTAAGAVGVIAIGLDSTSSPTGVRLVPNQTASVRNAMFALYSGIPGLGFHFLQALEYSVSGVAITFEGDGGVTYLQNGLLAKMRA